MSDGDDDVHRLGQRDVLDAALDALDDVLQAVGADVLFRQRDDVLGFDQVHAPRAEPRRHQPVHAGAGSEIQHDAVRGDGRGERARIGLVAPRIERHPAMA